MENTPNLRGDNPDERMNFVNQTRASLIKKRLNELEYNRKKEESFLRTGNYYYKNQKNNNRPFVRMEPTSLYNADFHSQFDPVDLRGAGRIQSNSIYNKMLQNREENFKELEMLKSGLMSVDNNSSSTKQSQPTDTSNTKLINNMVIELQSRFLDGNFEDIKVDFLRKLYREIETNPTELSSEDIKTNGSVLANMIDVYFNPPEFFVEKSSKIYPIPRLFNIPKTVWLYVFRILNLLVLINGNKDSQNLSQIVSSSSKELSQKTIEDSKKLYDRLIDEYPLRLAKKDFGVALQNRYDNMFKAEIDKKTLVAYAGDKRKIMTNTETNLKKQLKTYREFVLKTLDTKNLEQTDEKKIKEVLDNKTKLDGSFEIYIDNKTYTIDGLKEELRNILKRRGEAVEEKKRKTAEAKKQEAKDKVVKFIQDNYIDKMEEKQVDVIQYKTLLKEAIKMSYDEKMANNILYDFNGKKQTLSSIYNNRFDFFRKEFQKLLVFYKGVKDKNGVKGLLKDIDDLVYETGINRTEKIYTFAKLGGKLSVNNLEDVLNRYLIKLTKEQKQKQKPLTPINPINNSGDDSDSGNDAKVPVPPVQIIQTPVKPTPKPKPKPKQSPISNISFSIKPKKSVGKKKKN